LTALAFTATCQVVHPEGDATIREFKYLVRIDVEYNFPIEIRKDNTFYGGGVIVTNQWILTCAHNFIDKLNIDLYYSAREVTILAGTKNKYDRTSAQAITVSMENVIVHEDFDIQDLGLETFADVALIFLGENTLSFNERVQPANLISPDQELRLRSKCSIVGWGAYINEDEEVVQPEAARKGSLYVVESDNCVRCMNDGSDDIFDDNYHICYGCKGCKDCSMISPGDSGGPVVQQIGGIETVVGLSRSGTGRFTRECGKNQPGTAVKISAFRVWMDGEIKKREEEYGNERAQRNMAAAAASVAAAYFTIRMFR